MDNPCNRCMSFLECAGENPTCGDYVGFVEELNAKRLAAVRELMKALGHYSNYSFNIVCAMDALAAVWPEAVEG